MADDGTQIGKSGKRYPLGDPRLEEAPARPRRLVRQEDLPEPVDPADVIDPTELAAAVAEAIDPTELATAVSAAKLGALGYVNHGATAGTARPTGYAAVHWVGSVEPTNAADGDLWTDTSGA